MLIGLLISAGAGLLVGPFVNVAIDRLPPVGDGEDDRWIPTVRGRRRSQRVPDSTPDPKALLFAPIVGVLAFKGQGRSRKGLSFRRPLVDLALAGLFALSWVQFEGDWFRFIAVCVFATAIFALGVMDLETTYLPDFATYPTALAALIVSPFWPHLDYWDGVSGAVAGLAVFFPFAWYGSRTGRDIMGWGDVKFGGMLGAVLGLQMLITGLYLGILAGGVGAVAVLLVRGRERRPKVLPYGTFLALGGLAALYFGREILDWAGDTFIA